MCLCRDRDPIIHQDNKQATKILPQNEANPMAWIQHPSIAYYGDGPPMFRELPDASIVSSQYYLPLSNQVPNQFLNSIPRFPAPSHLVQPIKQDSISKYDSFRSSQIVPNPDMSHGQLQETQPEELWYYRDDDGNVQGPFSRAQMYQWNQRGFFEATLCVKWVDTRGGSDWMVLSEAFSSKIQAFAHSPRCL